MTVSKETPSLNSGTTARVIQEMNDYFGWNIDRIRQAQRGELLPEKSIGNPATSNFSSSNHVVSKWELDP